MPETTFRSIFGHYVPVLALLALWACTRLIVGAPRQEPSPRPAQNTPGNSHVIWAPGTTPSDLFTTVFQYANFSDVSGLTFNGNAGQKYAYLLLTPPETYQAGSVWYTNPVNVGQGFRTNFEFQIVPTTQSGTTADGMAFVIQNSALNALGGDGSDEGYTGIANSLAVEFDTYLSSGFADPNNNHVGIQSCGTAANTGDHATSCDLGLQSNPGITLADGKGHSVTISYIPGSGGAPGLFVVAIDHQVVLTRSIDLSTLLSLNGNDAWVGFTAGTGADFEAHTVRQWSLATAGTAAGQ